MSHERYVHVLLTMRMWLVFACLIVNTLVFACDLASVAILPSWDLVVRTVHLSTDTSYTIPDQGICPFLD